MKLKGLQSEKWYCPKCRKSKINIESQRKWCKCQKTREEEPGPMICCDNSNCVRKWFHYKCVEIEKKKKSEWYCGDCR